MTAKTLQELVIEVDAVLRNYVIANEDRPLLERLRADLEAALASRPSAEPASSLRNNLQAAIRGLELDHPRLTSLLSKTLDTLSDLGL